MPLAAVIKGATVIEKHFTLDKSLAGPDHKASLDPNELTEMVAGVRNAILALGTPLKGPQRSEVNNMSHIRESIVASKAIKKGEVFSEKNVGIKRPGGGRSPMEYWAMIGSPSERDYKADEQIS